MSDKILDINSNTEESKLSNIFANNNYFIAVFYSCHQTMCMQDAAAIGVQFLGIHLNQKKISDLKNEAFDLYVFFFNFIHKFDIIIFFFKSLEFLFL